ncbi:membrane transport protein [Salmonella bongori]|nr:membrane transport protein [Salmonella bongori]
MLAVITRLFPLWALLLSVIAYYTPSAFTPVGPWVTTLLMLIMFGMGVHLTLNDFKRVLSRPCPGRRRDIPALFGDAARGLATGAAV